MLTHIDLFAGIGGFSCGFQKAGFKTVAYVEKDKAAQAVLRHHHPDALILGDVKDAGKHNLPYADVITFGSPCQDLSVANRKRKGLSGERSNLFFEAIRIVSELKPSFAVWENVPGALTSNSGRDFANVLSAFRQCWARDIAWGTLDAQYFGVAQRRKRLFVVADFRGERAAEVLFERNGSYGNPPPSREAGQGLAADASNGIGSYRELAHGEYATDDKSSPIKARDYKSATDLVAYNVTFCDANGRRADRPNGGIDGTLVAAIDVRNSRSNGDISGTLQSKKSGGYSLNYINPIVFDWQAGVEGSLKLSENVSPCLKSSQDSYGGFTPAVLPTTGYGVRRLTPTECERLQGFPDGHTAVNGQSDSARYKQLGNAVCVNVAEWLGRRIVEAHASA